MKIVNITLDEGVGVLTYDDVTRTWYSNNYYEIQRGPNIAISIPHRRIKQITETELPETPTHDHTEEQPIPF